MEHRLISIGGALLRTHWNKGDAQRAIREGNFDFVVLQEQSTLPVKNACANAREHSAVRRRHQGGRREDGAVPDLARKHAPETQQAINEAYESIGEAIWARRSSRSAARGSSSSGSTITARPARPRRQPSDRRRVVPCRVRVLRDAAGTEPCRTRARRGGVGARGRLSYCNRPRRRCCQSVRVARPGSHVMTTAIEPPPASAPSNVQKGPFASPAGSPTPSVVATVRAGQPHRVGRRVPRARHVPDDGRGAAPRRRWRRRCPDSRLLGVPRRPPEPRRVGRLLAARPDPAVVLVPGRRRAAVLARAPGRRRGSRSGG